MKKLIIFAIVSLSAIIVRADTTTNRLHLTLPTIGSPTWGQKINGNFQILDATVTGQGSPNVFTSTNIFNGYVQFNSTVNWQNLHLGVGQCLGIDASSNTIIIQCGSGGGGSIQVTLAGLQISSPTATVNIDSTTMNAFQSPTGTANLSVVDVPHAGAQVNYAWLFNGSNGVWAPQGTSFNFSIAAFSDGQPTFVEIGTGTWMGVGGLDFNAAYNNGPATSGAVTGGGFVNLVLTNTFQGPTLSTATVLYLGSAASQQCFVLHAGSASGTDSNTICHIFNNDRYWGTSGAGGYTSSTITALGNSDLSNSVPNTFTVTAGPGQYIVYAYPLRLGTASFTVGGFTGGFQPPVTVSVTTGHGFTENYYAYRSTNANLGVTTVVVTTP